MAEPPTTRVHPAAIVEPGVELGTGSVVWDSAHLRQGARVGERCIIGEKCCIAGDVTIGDLCKLNTAVYVCAGVTIGRGVMLAAHVAFTNELHPRASDPDLAAPNPSEPTAATLRTVVDDGATVGANTTIGPGLVLGAWCTVGMGSVVTRDVPPHALVVGNPARIAGVVCRCGSVVARGTEAELQPGKLPCPCGRVVDWKA